jgi:hypothetical protein
LGPLIWGVVGAMSVFACIVSECRGVLEATMLR